MSLELKSTTELLQLQIEVTHLYMENWRHIIGGHSEFYDASDLESWDEVISQIIDILDKRRICRACGQHHMMLEWDGNLPAVWVCQICGVSTELGEDVYDEH
jgi:hypothetical protein